MSTPHPRSTVTVPDKVNAGRRRGSYRAARAFYLTLFIGTCLATFALLRQPQGIQHDLSRNILSRRDDVHGALNEDEECRLVHRANDQCTFIKEHCPADEAGFAAYLDLFYCRLPQAKPVSFVILISWLGLLFSTIGIAASDFFCINLSTIASILGMSESMAGVTLLAFGNGSPDVFSTFAAMSTNSGSLAVGELFGAAGFITAVVAGSMALIRPFHVARKSFIRDVGFFVVAAAFSISFLWDGRLHLWECIAMVVFYIFYVAFVVAWHWWIGRRRRRREKEAAARGHFLAPGDEYDIEQDQYHDNPEETEEGRPTVIRGVSIEDWSALERNSAGIYNGDGNEDEEEEERDRWMSELSSNMRLTRPTRSRRNTLNPVRPSLVGALEFQAVLKSLHKSKNFQTIPLNARRYSDDPTFTTAQQQDQMSTLSDPASRPPYQVNITDEGSPTVERQSLNVPVSAPGRTRAVSANDASSLRIDADLRRPTPSHGSKDDLHDGTSLRPPAKKRSTRLDVPGRQHHSQPQSPIVEISHAPFDERPEAPLRIDTSHSQALSDHLAPPDQGNVFRATNDHFAPRALRRSGTDSPHDSPHTVPSARSLPRIIIPGDKRSRPSTPTSPFPRYRDDPSPANSRPPSIHLPPAMASPESIPVSQTAEQEAPKRPIQWWPYKLLPPPGVIIATLFPTIYHWHDKSWWEKILGIVAAPSVFFLTITLPVVENDKDGEDEPSPRKEFSVDSARSKSVPAALGQGSAGLQISARDEATEDHHPGSHRHSLTPNGLMGLSGTAALATSNEQHQRHNFGEGVPHHIPSIALEQQDMMASPMPVDNESEPIAPELWNRWLTIIQLFLAPIFVVLSIYSQSPTDMSPNWLIRPILYCLLASAVVLIPLLLTTTPTHRPTAYRTILSLCGFVVSIAWISTIAAQVVGALKALAVILNMSHAIMGLTIFAVGNSLGDLVADVTVANLGYPVMALSACFGGPMLNILLGIGLSGSYILIRGAENRHERHPEKGIRFRSYHIEVSTTLIVSGATLLVTLLGLLVFVPLNKWVLSRKIGWALIALWTLSTIGNVVLEVTGFGDDGSEG